MDIRARDTDRELLLEFSGEMDHHGARNALKEVEIAIDAALPRSLILDFAGVTFMDSSGIALILRSQQRMQLMEGSVVLRNVPEHNAALHQLHPLLRPKDQGDPGAVHKGHARKV